MYLAQLKHIQELLVEGFDDWQLLGDIVCRRNGRLAILNYNRPIEWNPYECLCRGLILDSVTGAVVARPFDKFFNWLEGGRKAKGHIKHVFEKVDGSLGILYWDEGHKIATRGSFDSDQALWATDFLQQYDLSYIPAHITLLFEIVYPDNRIVVNYGDREDLVLLGARDRLTGEYIPYYPTLFNWNLKWGFTWPKQYTFNSVRDILEATGTANETVEGWVAVFSDGSRWKFKGDRYVELHKLVSRYSPKTIYKIYREMGLKMLMKHVPDYLQAEVRSMVVDWVLEYQAIYKQTQEIMQDIHFENRKYFALYVREEYPDISSVLFALLDKKDPEPHIWRIVEKTFGLT